ERVHTSLAPKSTSTYLRQLLSELSRLSDLDPSERKTSAAGTLTEVAERIARRSLVVIITDLFENVARHEDVLRALRHLRHRGHEVLVFHVLESATERQFQFPDVPMLFRDMETGEQVTLQPAQLRENYQEAVRVFTES